MLSVCTSLFKNENSSYSFVVDGVGNPSDSAMRDFSAKCLTEFLRWSLKQTTKQVYNVGFFYCDSNSYFTQQQEKNPFNAKSLFKRLYNLAHHPDPYKRLGAALTFNEIHRVFREEEALVDQFVLEMMHNNVSHISYIGPHITFDRVDIQLETRRRRRCLLIGDCRACFHCY